jgi:hypothetical protein
VAGEQAVSGLRDALEDYLAVRRSLGFKMETAGRLLAGFVAFAEQAGAPTVTTELALARATAPAAADPAWWRGRLDAIRPFARYLTAFIPGTEVPPGGLIPGPASCRAVPYLYSPAEITALLAAAGAIRAPLKAATYQTLTGLLAVTAPFSRGAKRTWESFSCFGCSGSWVVSRWVRQVWWNSGRGVCGLDGPRRHGRVSAGVRWR